MLSEGTQRSMQIEWHQIELKYERLHVVDPHYRTRVMTSLATEGQQRPVLVVDADPTANGGSYILIDGYVRVAALRRLGRDTVEAMVLPIGEVEALLLAHRLDGQRSRSVLEEAWLLRELVEGHGRTQAVLGRELGRAKGWVSRRLALVRILPEEVQDAVRSGLIPAHGAMKYLVPLARANPGAVIELVKRLGNEPVTVRQLERLYTAWRAGDCEQRERILAEPRLFLKTSEELERQRQEERSASLSPGAMGANEQARALLAQLRTIRTGCRRACGHLDGGALGAAGVLLTDLRRAFAETRLAFAALSAGLAEEEIDAGSRHPFGNLSACA
jgi:ParB/RepB/Spo0J family partition protein